MAQVDLRQDCLVTKGENAVKARAVKDVNISTMLSNEHNGGTDMAAEQQIEEYVQHCLRGAWSATQGLSLFSCSLQSLPPLQNLKKLYLSGKAFPNALLQSICRLLNLQDVTLASSCNGSGGLIQLDLLDFSSLLCLKEVRLDEVIPRVLSTAAHVRLSITAPADALEDLPWLTHELRLSYLLAECHQEVSENFQALLWYLASHGSLLQRMTLFIKQHEGNIRLGRLSGLGPLIPNFQALKELFIYVDGKSNVDLFLPRLTSIEHLHVEAKTLEVEFADPDRFVLQMLRLGLYYTRVKRKCLALITDALARAAEKNPRVQFQACAKAAIREEGRACYDWSHAFVAFDASRNS